MPDQPDTPAALQSMAFSPADPFVAYLGTSGMGIYQSADGGLTWRASAPLMHEAYGDKVWAEFTSFGEDTGWLMLRGVYVGAGTHFAMQLLHSTDSGLTWVSLPGADIGVDYTSLTFANTETGWMGWQSHKQ